MKPIWEIDGEDVETLQGDSAGFVRFLNALLSSQAHAGRLSDSTVHLNRKDTEGDGGVDAVIDQPIPPTQGPTGWFGVPTCWQFKASPTENIKAKVARGEEGGQEIALRQEINKRHARRLIEQGYGYRFCIADDMPHQKQAEWERWLLGAAQEIRQDAAAPMVLTASDLARWANRFTPIVSDYFRPYLGQFRSLERWHGEIAALTPDFVAIGGWDAAIQAIREHVDFSHRVATVLTVHGEAGVGKTRCTCEALFDNATHHALLLYTSDEQRALEFTQIIARDNRKKAILVADECSLETRDRLRQILPGCSDRLRVVAIDNSLQRTGGSGEVRLTQLGISEVEAILQKNFPTLPPERCLSYARLAQGFVRLAVDLCEHDALVPPDGRVDSVFGFFRDYYLQRRLRPEELEAVQLIALLPRVGYRDDVTDQLAMLCNHTMIGRSPADIVGIAQRLRQSPGFVAFGGRFLYVTPMLIAQVAIQWAWERWIEPDPRRFLAGIPAELIDSFAERVQTAGTLAMRQVVSDFFLGWVTNLRGPDLGREEVVSRLVRLIEVQPETLVPLLRSLIESGSPDELRQLHSGYRGEKARRELVWLAEKLGYFAEYFADAEAMLYRLALAETEPHLGNSATRVWTSLFRIVLSGTAVPFAERLRLLEERLRGAGPTEVELVLGALEEIIVDGPVSRLAAPPVVFGRLPPPQWRPADRNERRDCCNLALATAARLAATGGPVGDGVRMAVVKNLAHLILGGYIEEARAIVGSGPLPDTVLAAVTRQLERFLEDFCKQHSIPIHQPRDSSNSVEDDAAGPESSTRILPRVAGVDLEARVRDWYQNLVPSDLHGRLVSIVGQEPWHQQLGGDSNAWQSALRELAAELLRSPAALVREQAWLCSTEARSAFHLGQALGQADGAGVLLDRMLWEIPLAGGTSLARGYLDRLATAHPCHLDRANDLLDRLESGHPRLAFDILWSAGDEMRKVPRMFQLVDSGALPAEFLRGLEHGVRDRALTIDELLPAIERLIRSAQAGNGRAAHAAVHLLCFQLHSPRQVHGTDLLRQDRRLQEILPRVLELALGEVGSGPVPWTQLLDDLATVAPVQAVRLAVHALVGEEYNLRELAEDFLIRLAGLYPSEVMRGLGEAILSPVCGWRFHVHDFSRLIGSLPAETTQRWLEVAGVPGARGLARHLKAPLLDDEGRPVVPPLTAFVFDRFEDDDQVFQEFCAGSVTEPGFHGDFPSHLDHKAEVARHFLRHSVRRVREWALGQLEFARRETAFRRQYEEEMVHP